MIALTVYGPPDIVSSGRISGGFAVTATRGVTELLIAWGEGDRGALDALLPIVYDELRRQAARALRRERCSIQPTTLVHEAYFRLVQQNRVQWRNRAQFFGIAGQIIRRILVDHERKRRAIKRGGGGPFVTLERFDPPAPDTDSSSDVLAVHEALDRLAQEDTDLVRLVELRYFAGLTIQETALALGVSVSTVKRELQYAAVRLKNELASA